MLAEGVEKQHAAKRGTSNRFLIRENAEKVEIALRRVRVKERDDFRRFRKRGIAITSRADFEQCQKRTVGR